MSVLCSACQGPTEPQQFTNKMGIPTTAYACLGACRNPKNPKYPLSTFPPRMQNAPLANPVIRAGEAPSFAPKPPDGSVEKHLGSIAHSLQEIVSILRLSKDPLEKEAREKTPF